VLNSRPRRRAGLALTAAAALAATLLSSYGAPQASADPTGAPGSDGATRTGGRAEQHATAALGRARAVVDGRARGDLTMALRDVATSREHLVGADRAAADRLLARPGDGTGDDLIDWSGERVAKPVCSSSVCVHYVTTGDDAPSLADADDDGTPDYVETVLRTVGSVRTKYLGAGYRAPKRDGALGGGSNKFDVYLGELGRDGYYGYCIPDEPTTSANRTRYDRYSFCGLDNDYAEFPTNTPRENLQVTVAHEYFHATQFAYDAFEDGWLLEATAAWIEDEVYDAVDDNVQYLRTSPITRPSVSLDTFSTSGSTNGFHYGTWSFFRFLSERYPAEKGGLPKLVLDVFRVADGAPGGDDNYSWQAVDRVLRAKGTSGAKMLAGYAVANRRASTSYAEGRTNRYPSAPLYANARVSERTGYSRSLRLNHLATATVRLTPQSVSSGYRLQLELRLQPTARGASALVTTASKGGRLTTTTVALDRDGDATKRVGFGSASVAWVEVTLVNGSGRFRCFTQTGAYSCQGSPLDQSQPVTISARAMR
jgi:hypothetical protein